MTFRYNPEPCGPDCTCRTLLPPSDETGDGTTRRGAWSGYPDDRAHRGGAAPWPVRSAARATAAAAGAPGYPVLPDAVDLPVRTDRPGIIRRILNARKA